MNDTKTYMRESGQVEYRSKACSRPQSGNGKQTKIFDALEWIAAMCSHVPNKGESSRWREFGTMATTATVDLPYAKIRPY